MDAERGVTLGPVSRIGLDAPAGRTTKGSMTSASPSQASATPASRVRPARESGTLAKLFAGVDAALMVTALGLMYSLLIYGPLGAQALPVALFATIASLLVGGVIAALTATQLGASATMIAGPTATGALVIAGMIPVLQRLPGASGIAAAIIATATTTVLAGVLQLVFARARVGTALKFVPYPVLMGFVNAVGLSLVISVIPFALGHEGIGRLLDVTRWFDDPKRSAIIVTLVGTACGYASLRWLKRLPATFVALVAATATHHLIAATCTDCALGPRLGFEHAGAWPDLATAFSGLSFGPAWWALIGQTALTIAILNSLFSLLVAAYLTRPQDPPVDGNHLLTTLGASSVGAGLLAGIPIALITSVSLAIREIRGRALLPIAAYFATTAFVFLVGRELFSIVPMAAVASSVFVIARTQFDASTWTLLRQARRRRASRRAGRGALVVAMLVVAVAVTRSLAAALFVGALAAVCLLAIEMRRGVVVGQGDGRSRHSRRVRTPAERDRLDAESHRIFVIELGHWLYFGTADELAAILDTHEDVEWVLIDAHRVAGIDLTAARSLVHAAERLGGRGARLVVAGLPDGDPRRSAIDALRTTAGGRKLRMVPDIDHALERAEDALLGAAPDPEAAVAAAFERFDAATMARLEPWLATGTLEAGATLFRAGDPGDAMYLVVEGRVTLWVDGHGRARVRLLTFGAGGLFGEMALLDGRDRSTHAQADVACRLRILKRETFARIAREDPALHVALLEALSLQLVHRLRETNALLGEAMR